MNFFVIIIALIGGNYVFVLLHELGHFFAALLVGWKPLTLSLGFGARRTLFKLAHVRFQVGSRPAGGFVEAVALSPSGFRLKYFIFIVAGPLVSAGLIWMIWSVLRRPDSWLRSEPWTTIAGYLVIVESFILVSNLWPRYIEGWLATDGLQMWQALTLKRAEIPIYCLVHSIALARRLIEDGHLVEAKARLELGMRQGDTSDRLSVWTMWIHLLFEQGHQEEADAACRELLDPSATHDIPRVVILDGLASLPVFYEHPNLVPRAIEWVNEAIALDPEKITLKGTKASLLVEAGELDAGLQMIEEVSRTTTSEDDRAICAYYEALAHYQMGDTGKADEHLRQALTKYPTCAVAPRTAKRMRNSRLLDSMRKRTLGPQTSKSEPASSCCRAVCF